MLMNAIRPDVRTAITAIVDNLLHDYKLETCGIEAADDATGDAAIFVDLCYELNEPEVDPAITTAVRTAIRESLLMLGEARFPYIRHHLQDGQRVKGYGR
jgi:hypothetical protein